MASSKEMLLNQLSDPAAKTKIAAKFGGYIRDRLRESSFAEQVLPPENVDRSQCQVSTQHDSLVKIEFLEPRSRAMTVTFRGEPRANFIRGEKVEVPFITVMSDMFQKPEQEFLAYAFPIGKVIEQNAVRDLGEVQDREFLIHIEAAVQALQTEANGGVPTALNATTVGAGSVVEFSVTKGELARIAVSNTAVSLPIQRPDIVRLIKLLDGNRLESNLVLITTVDWDDILAWTVEDQGDKLQSETAVQGWKYNLLLGKRYVRTIKTDILRPGNVYCFTSPDFLGKFYVLNNVKFYIDKYINMLKFVAWKDIGMSIVNIASVRKLELYSGDANPTTNADGILGSVTPVAEEDLGRPNNRAGNRQFFPQVVSIG
jgi:hypothetical protein